MAYTAEQEELFRQACELLAAGYVLIGTKDKQPVEPFKDPALPCVRTPHDAAERIGARNANGFGIHTRLSGVDMIDLDVRDGVDAVAWWSTQGMPGSPMASTSPRGGAHLFYRARPGRPLRTSQSKIAPGVDTLGGAANQCAIIIGAGRMVAGIRAVAELPELPDAVVALVPAVTREPGQDGAVVLMTETAMHQRFDAACKRVAGAAVAGGGRGLIRGAAMDARRMANAGVLTEEQARQALDQAVRAAWPAGADSDDQRWIDEGWDDALDREVWQVGDPDAEWLASMGTTAEQVMAQGKGPAGVPPATQRGRAGERHAVRELPPPSRPLAVLDVLAPELADIRYYAGQWLVWAGPQWVTEDEIQIRKRLIHATANAFYLKQTKEMVVQERWDPTPKKISDLLETLRAEQVVPGHVQPGDWLDGSAGRGDHISCANGLLRLADRELRPHNLELFNTVSSPFDYTADSAPPARWLAFLRSVWPDEIGPGGVEVTATEIRTLQQWFGYVLSGRTDQEKAMALVGPPRSGKGTIVKTLERLIGEGNRAAFTMSGLSGDFGLSNLVGKSLAVDPDVRWSKKVINGEVVANLLSITGQDAVSVRRKYREPVDAQLGVRIMLCSNERPAFHDDSAALASRFITLRMTVSHVDSPDIGLKDALVAELPAILRWSLDGLADLERAGEFAQSERSRQEAERAQESASPALEFLRTVCVVTGDHGWDFITRDELRQAWNTWATLNGVSLTWGLQKIEDAMQAADARCRPGSRGATKTRKFARGIWGVKLRSMNDWASPEARMAYVMGVQPSSN